MDDLLRELRRLSPAEAEEAGSQGALVLDTRSPSDYASGAVPGSLNISLDGQFAPWLGALVPMEKPLVLICDPGREEEAVTRCGRIGYENIRGILDGGIGRWEAEGRRLVRFPRLNPSDFVATQNGLAPTILDVRNSAESAGGAVPGSIHIPLNRLKGSLSGLASEGPLHVYCGSGYRSAMAVSLLKQNGWNNVSDLDGGFAAYRQAGQPMKEASNA
jgi:rhodanese-related sulfurtransferase